VVPLGSDRGRRGRGIAVRFARYGYVSTVT